MDETSESKEALFQSGREVSIIAQDLFSIWGLQYLIMTHLSQISWLILKRKLLKELMPYMKPLSAMKVYS